MKKLAWLGIITLALVLLIGGTIGFSKAIFTSRYETEIAAIKAKGEPVTWSELLGPPVPASDNAAEVYNAIRRKEASGAYRSDYAVVDQVIALKGSPMDAKAKQKLAKAITHARPILDLAAEAVLKPRYQLYPDPATGQADYQHLTGLRDACRLLTASAVLNAQSNDMDAAVDDVCMQFRIATQLGEGPSYIQQLVRIAIIAISSASAENLTRYGRLSEQQARRLFDAVGRVDVEEGFRRSWLGERVLFLSQRSLSAMTGPPGPAGTSGPTASGFLDSIYRQTIYRGDRAEYLGVVAGQLDALGLSYPKARARGVFDAPNLPIYAIFSKMLSPILVTGGVRRYDAETLVARTQVFLALQAYKARYGGYPASMKELKSKLGWKLPKDPFSEKDFIYKRLSKGFVLYSVGPDMKDDGGRSIPSNMARIDSKGDIVLVWER